MFSFSGTKERKGEVQISMAKGNEELMSRMGTARLKYDEETDEKAKKRGGSMERSKAGTKMKSRRPMLRYARS